MEASLMLSCVIICSDTQKAQAEKNACALLQQGADVVVLVTPTPCVLPDVDCVVSQPPFLGFSAGYNRDLGVQHVLNTYGPSDFLFIDGDCVPSCDLVKHHRDILASCDYVIGCGLRVNQSSNGTLRVDRRLGHPATRMRLFVKGTDRVLLNAREVISHSAAWSCNLSVSYKTVLSVMRANKLVCKSENRLFNPVFDGTWGGEDTLLGAFGFRTGSKLVFLNPDRSHVVHIDHVSNSQGTDNLVKCVQVERTTLSLLPSTCTITVKRKDNIDPRPDTVDFYANLVDLPVPDPTMSHITSRLSLRSRAEEIALHYLFSPNPVCRYVDVGETSSVSPQRVLELFNQVRTEVFTLQDLGVCK